MKELLTLFLVMHISFGFAQDFKAVESVEGIEIGDKVPLFTAISADSTDFSLEAALAEGPVVVIFYRGFWCSHCNKHLSIVQDSLSLIENAGAQVIAISPEKPEFLDKMADKTGAKFRLLYDENQKISDAFGVNFKPTTRQINKYNMFLNAKLKESHTDDTERLPIPATYIIGKDATVVWRQFDQDYKNRSNVADILEELSFLK